MGINPGNPAFGLPPAEDSLVRQLKDLERTTRENLASVVRSFKGTVAELRATQEELATAQAGLAATQSELATAQSNLAGTQSELVTAQADLATQQSTLTTTVGRLDDTITIQNQTIADLQDVVNAQVLPKVASGSAGGFYVTSSFANIASASITVPAGYSRALVSASGQVTAGNDDAMDVARLYAHITINGNAGPDSISSVASLLWASASAFAAFNLTGLSGGTISVQIAAKLSNGTTSESLVNFDNASIVTQAIFLR